MFIFTVYKRTTGNESNNKVPVFSFLLLFTMVSFLQGQPDYTNLNNWAFHPHKTGSLLANYNLDIALIDIDLQTDSIFEIPNNAVVNTGVDIFFVHPTILYNITGYTTRENIPLQDQPAFMIAAGIIGQGGLLAQYGRMFAPRYRQATPPTFLGSPLDSVQAAVIGTAYADVKAAFQYYLTHHNMGNKIILAGHSQGAYHAAMLLREFFDNNTELQEQLVVAVVAGIVAVYAGSFDIMGGWWKNIPICTQIDQCNCVMTWRSYKEGQVIPAIAASHMAGNPVFQAQGLVYKALNHTQDWLLQDSLFYASQALPLRNYITSSAPLPYGENAGFVAFDSLYQIRYHRASNARVGFLVEHTPEPGDQRPDLLLAEEDNPLFSYLGYHNRDYNIYLWALLEQINAKLEHCDNPTGTSQFISQKTYLNIAPNPARDWLQLTLAGEPLSDENVWITSLSGQIIQMGHTDGSGRLSISNMPGGLYFLNTRFGATKLIKQK